MMGFEALLSQATAGIAGECLSDGRFTCIAFSTESEQRGFLTFLEKERFLESLENPNIACVVTTYDLKERIPAHIQGIFLCTSPKKTLFEIHNRLSTCEGYTGKSFPTRVGNNCSISPLCSIPAENVVIGDNVTIEPFVVLKGRVTIGNNVTIRAGTIVGCKGFSFSKDADGNNISVNDTAEIIIEDDVELFEHVAISTGIFPWEKTIIGRNTKIDAQCHIGHGAHIGCNCMIAEGGRCCGNSRIGDGVWVGVGAVVSNRVTVGSGARVSIGAVATKAVAAGTTVSGNFAIDHQRFLRNLKASLSD